MSVTPSLKDKVEFTLDNRQIFFLFFGLSVVGCFVFAMGVMVGRRGELQDNPQVAQVQQGVLAEDEPALADAYSFKDGLQHPATEGLPATRDPQTPPRDEEAVRAEREAALAKGKKPGSSTKKLPPIPAPSQKPAMASAPKMMPPLAGSDAPAAAKQPEPAAAAPAAPPAVALVEKPKDTLLTAVQGDAAGPKTPAAAKNYTLQMKAFSSPEDAEKLAERLRRNGHDVRVETGEANGRTWHRVRMGHFDNWEAAVSAKAAFEKNEQVIAYVVTL
jgi:cell division protein FtsN